MRKYVQYFILVCTLLLCSCKSLDRTVEISITEDYYTGSFVNVITNLRDEAAKQKSRLKAEDIHLCLLLSLGYSIGVIRECLTASSDDVVRKRRVRLGDKLPEDILQLFSV